MSISRCITANYFSNRNCIFHSYKVYDGNQVDEIGKKGAQKVEASSTVETASSRAPEALDAVKEAPNDTTVDPPNVERLQQLQQELARLKELKQHADSIETSAPGVSITTDTPKKSQLKVAVPDTSSAKAFLPERKK